MTGVLTYLVAVTLFSTFLAGTLLFVVPGFIGLASGHPWGIAGATGWWLLWSAVITVWQGSLLESALPTAVPYLVAIGVLGACIASIYRTINVPQTEQQLFPDRLVK